MKSVADGGIDRSTKTVRRERGPASRRNDDAERNSERAQRPFLMVDQQAPRWDLRPPMDCDPADR